MWGIRREAEDSQPRAGTAQDPAQEPRAKGVGPEFIHSPHNQAQGLMTAHSKQNHF